MLDVKLSLLPVLIAGLGRTVHPGGNGVETAFPNAALVFFVDTLRYPVERTASIERGENLLAEGRRAGDKNFS